MVRGSLWSQKKAGNAGTATVKGYGTGDIHPNVSGSKGSNWNGGNNKRGIYNSVNKGNKGWNNRSHSGNWNRGSVSHWNHQKKHEFVAANNKSFIVDKQGHNGKENKQGQSSPDSMEKISAESCPTSDLLVNNSDSGQTEAIESKCDTRVNSNLENHDCLNPMNDILELREVKKHGRKERRHKEAQDVLAAATTAAAASSRLSSFRKDTLEESAHHEVVDSHFVR
ncbi:unnamed protein product [Lactuca saligna]|uniref:Uncharacterized protein n=1 Tax=Lactuca saligna TaxID=75948 RepID=A0AA35Y6L8_LACSI|nr:unnamed protein product [Lactuca saligna]CAI9259775.1 unnamed protein product [Lactuca saligna]